MSLMVILPLLVTIGVLLVLLGGLAYVAFGPVPGKTLTIAQAAYLEAVRQPLFWFLLAFAVFFMVVNVFVPYFTLGEDLKMMKDLQLDAILVPTLILTIFTAALSVSEEIEGRTAVTVLSKPISRRQFLLGKFFGVIFAALLMATLLTIVMGASIVFRIRYERIEAEQDKLLPSGLVEDDQAITSFVTESVPTWAAEPVEYTLNIVAAIRAMSPGPVLIMCQITILTAIAVALATRLPLVVNLVACLTIFFLGRLTMVLEVAAGDNTLVKFFARLFGTLLPSFNYFDVGQTLASGLAPVPWLGFVIPGAMVHAALYTAIALFFGLILFEDRDVA